VGPSTFECGQAYVALSRVRSLEALFIYEITPRAFKAHPAVKDYYASIDAPQESDDAAIAADDA